MSIPDIEFDQQIRQFLAVSRTASLATTNAALGPHAANIQYVSDDALHLYWVSSPDARHSRDLVVDPRAAVTIYAHDDRPDQIHGLQLHGRAAAIDTADWSRVWNLYTTKFTFIRTTPALERAVTQQTFYHLTPTRLRWIDNRRGFGWKVERDLLQ